MSKVFYFIFLNILILNSAFAKDINIQENLNLEFICELEKKIVKNSEYNYKTFLAEELNDKNLDSFKIYSNKPNTLLINGLSKFFSQNSNMEVKIVNKDVVLFKAFNNEKTYSESAIITRKSGELIHEVTRNINSENSEKDISIYYCKNKSKNA
ncbi:MAG: hypothetical protein ACJZ4W_02455 [Candidatus Pelagibacter sp.]|jgi:hypothetical protein|tara:strand:+ start:149 stop:610 length:462 start_codon:yes stop_codon:yes gene_type:complete